MSPILYLWSLSPCVKGCHEVTWILSCGVLNFRYFQEDLYLQERAASQYFESLRPQQLKQMKTSPKYPPRQMRHTPLPRAPLTIHLSLALLFCFYLTCPLFLSLLCSHTTVEIGLNTASFNAVEQACVRVNGCDCLHGVCSESKVSGVTIEYQRAQAKALQQYFRDLNAQKTAEKAQ